MLCIPGDVVLSCPRAGDRESGHLGVCVCAPSADVLNVAVCVLSAEVGGVVSAVCVSVCVCGDIPNSTKSWPVNIVDVCCEASLSAWRFLV